MREKGTLVCWATVNGALDDLVSHADCGMLRGTVLRLACDFLPVASDIDVLAVPGMGDVKGIVLCHPQPVLLAFLTEVALDDEMAPTLQEDADVLGGVIPGVKPEEQGPVRQLAAEADGLFQELGRIFLAVLLPFAQLQVGKVSFFDRQTWAHSHRSLCRSGTRLPCMSSNCRKGTRPCLQGHIRKAASMGRCR